MLHEIQESNVYCGPAALISLTGKRLPEVRKIINEIKGKRGNVGVMGMAVNEMGAVLRALSIPYTFEVIKGKCPRLIDFVEQKPKHVRMIVTTTSHFVTIFNGTVFDNFMRYGCAVSEHPKRRTHVKNYFVIGE